ncbi:MAG: plasmid recombination protein [Tetragenococcus halophilus]|uniref:MobV family relaxase n=1 Tax=Staphylococcus equorum TaxID=246432 RepID=UPI0025556E12|nr:MobV family relaxase [Staphylococcus equorum]MDK9844914.1 MobV family relaxase [Staphylococcus equorum]MDN6146658.1 plasmid recombination protein [Tetragenococcus koreensis]MDN6541801.1 plasmid recombination protein [Tetragenococcus koreensis]MDN6608048.1 plasmid recombination protein [Tetragenococcus halophilus]
MSYSIIRVAKVKSKTNTTGLQKHVQRENKNYENLDIDLGKSHLNYDLVNNDPINYNLTIDKKIEENYTGKRKIRSDAVKHIDGLITSDNEFFEGKSQDDIRVFFEDSKTFIEKEYGKEHLIYATVHMDERTPHMHYGVVPITTDGRLSAKDVVGNKKALTEFQDRFNEYLNDKGYDLERGTSKHKTKAKHDEVESFKQKTEFHQKQLENSKQDYDKFAQRRDELGKEIKHKFNDKRQLQTDNQLLIEQLEILRVEKETEKAKLDEIKANREKEEQEYQKMIKALKEPVNTKYEYEYKKPNLFSEERYKTDNVIVSKATMDQLSEQAQYGRRIAPDYEKLMNGERYQELQEDLELQREKIIEQDNKMANAKRNYNKIKQEKDEMIKDQKETNQLLNKTCGVIKGWIGEKIYHKGIDYVDTHMQRNQKIRNIMTVDENDKSFFEKKDRVILQKQFEQQSIVKEQDKGFDLDL